MRSRARYDRRRCLDQGLPQSLVGTDPEMPLEGQLDLTHRGPQDALNFGIRQPEDLGEVHTHGARERFARELQPLARGSSMHVAQRRDAVDREPVDERVAQHVLLAIRELGGRDRERFPDRLSS